MTTTCTGCRQPLDLTQPHVKILRHVEREQPGTVLVDDADVLGQWHIDHAPITARDQRDDPASTNLTSALERALAELKATVDEPDLMCSLSHEQARALFVELRALRARLGITEPTLEELT